LPGRGGLLAALVDRQEAVLDRQGQNAHRRRVGRAVAVAAQPGAVVLLVRQQRLVQPVAVGAPDAPAQLDRRLRTVVDRVETMPRAPGRGVVDQEGARPLGIRAGVLALTTADLQPQDARPGAGDGVAAPRRVPEAAGARVLRALDVL